MWPQTELLAALAGRVKRYPGDTVATGQDLGNIGAP